MTRLRRIGYVLLGEVATTRLFYGLHRAIYRLSGGRIFARSVGCPVVLLTTTGRKSGEPRTAPIFGFQKGQSVVVVPSNAGKKHYPSWYFNLRSNPQAQVQLGSQLWQVRAREATLEERERLWPFLASQYGGYDVYRQRTDRHIPVLILERVEISSDT
jgi:deazaflavin-dependent oxidoreductase (nitroreductase family)